MEELNQTFWDQRHRAGQTGWDIKQVSPPLRAYFEAPLQHLGHVFIPGCGKAYEAMYLWEKGLKQISILDFAPSLIASLKMDFEKTEVEVINGDIFTHRGLYNTIVEQTLFCAIDPKLRLKYVNQIADLLHENGIWFGVLFNRQFEKEGPPFGGSEMEYRSLLAERFEVLAMHECSNSIAPRAGTELFFCARKRK